MTQLLTITITQIQAQIGRFPHCKIYGNSRNKTGIFFGSFSAGQ